MLVGRCEEEDDSREMQEPAGRRFRA